jgi:hypothetical protein
VIRTTAFLAIAAAATPAAAFAQTNATTQSSSAATTGPIEIAGTEPVACGAAFDRASATVDLTANASQDVQVSVACNARFTIRARSNYGRFQRDTGYSAADPRTFVTYQVSWPMTLLDSDGAPIAPGFSASGDAWAAGIAASSAPTRLTQSGRMTISWQTQANVLAGNYGDIFFLDIVPN